MKLALDTSTIVEFLLREPPSDPQALATWRACQAINGNHGYTLYLPAPAYAEVLVDLENRDAFESAIDTLEWRTIDFSAPVARLAAEAMEVGFQAKQRGGKWRHAMKADAMILACAEYAGCDGLVAVDGDHRRMVDRLATRRKWRVQVFHPAEKFEPVFITPLPRPGDR